MFHIHNIGRHRLLMYDVRFVCLPRARGSAIFDSANGIGFHRVKADPGNLPREGPPTLLIPPVLQLHAILLHEIFYLSLGLQDIVEGALYVLRVITTLIAPLGVKLLLAVPGQLPAMRPMLNARMTSGLTNPSSQDDMTLMSTSSILVSLKVILR